MSRIGLDSGGRKKEFDAFVVPEGTSLIFSSTTGDAYIGVFADKGGTQLIFGSGFISMTFQGDTLTAPTVSADAGRFQTLTALGGIIDQSVLSPANLTASQNNWAPGATGVRNIRLSANAGLSITGLSAGQTTGRLIRLFNIGSNAITIAHESGSSSAANRFLCPGSSNFSLAANAAVDLWYDGASSRWRLVR